MELALIRHCQPAPAAGLQCDIQLSWGWRVSPHPWPPAGSLAALGL